MERRDRTRERERMPSQEEVRAIIREDDPEGLVKLAERVGRTLQRQGLSTSQIRNIFGTVRKIAMDWPESGEGPRIIQAKRELILLKPKLAYQASRESGRAVQSLQRVLTPAIDEVKGNRGRFGRFADFFEAILAYHRAAGGR